MQRLQPSTAFAVCFAFVLALGIAVVDAAPTGTSPDAVVDSHRPGQRLRLEQAHASRLRIRWPCTSSLATVVDQLIEDAASTESTDESSDESSGDERAADDNNDTFGVGEDGEQHRAAEDNASNLENLEDDVKQSVRRISRILRLLFAAVDELRNNYSRERHVGNIGMHVDGMPLLRFLNPASEFLNTFNLTTTLVEATNKISSVALFLELLLIEESSEPRSFYAEITQLENHPEHGLYTVLCHLHRTVQISAVVDGQKPGARRQLTAAVDEISASGLSLPEVTHRSHRHVRSYSILHDFAELLQHLSAHFSFISNTFV